MNKEHVMFALKRWAEAKGKVLDNYGKRHFLDFKTMTKFEDTYSFYTPDGYGLESATINYDFCRNLPVDSLEQSYFILEYLANRCDGIIGIFNATLEQRLEAYYEAENAN